MFSSIQQALQFLKDQMSSFGTMNHTLNARLATIDALMKQAQAANDQASLGKLIVAKSQAVASQKEYSTIAEKLGPFRAFFIENPSLGIFPLWIAGGAVALASTVYMFMQKVRNEGTTLELIKAGILKPADAKGILGGGIADTLSNASNLVLYGAIAYGLFLFGPLILKKVK